MLGGVFTQRAARRPIFCSVTYDRPGAGLYPWGEGIFLGGAGWKPYIHRAEEYSFSANYSHGDTVTHNIHEHHTTLHAIIAPVSLSTTWVPQGGAGVLWGYFGVPWVCSGCSEGVLPYSRGVLGYPGGVLGEPYP